MTGLATAPPPTHGHPPRRRGGLLRQRDFRLFWIGQTASSFGSSVTSVALPLVAVATLEASTFQVALLTAATWLPWLLVGLPAGAWVDRLPRRPLMVTCDLFAAVLFLSVPVAAALGVLTVGQLLVVAFAGGVVHIFFFTAYQVYLPALLARPDLPEANAKLQGTESVAHVAGPGAAGLLAQLVGVVNALLVDVASFVGSAICLLAIRTREPRETGVRPARNLWREITEGVRFTARDPYLRVFALFGALSNLGLVSYQAILVVFLVREVGASPGTVGLVTAGMSVGGVLGAALTGVLRRRFGSARALLVGSLGTLPFGLLIPLTGPGPRLGLVVIAGMAIGAGAVSGNVLRGAFRQAYVPRELLGRVMVTMQVVNLGPMPLGAVVGGLLGTTLGLRPAMWCITGYLALTGLVLLVGPLARRRDLPDRPAPHRG
ncbi:MFS transporter [Plantactinospora sp. B5E13]|uniref:MFS transporter n=1 Tax=Plantactinospora sp. B5E13 TaxID=3153758 RepID=UPI00325D7AB6